MEKPKIFEIHDSFVNGQKKQMVEFIDAYGLFYFWKDYQQYLASFCENSGERFYYFSEVTITYHRIKNRG
jgi:hypothetical protein